MPPQLRNHVTLAMHGQTHQRRRRGAATQSGKIIALIRPPRPQFERAGRGRTATRIMQTYSDTQRSTQPRSADTGRAAPNGLQRLLTAQFRARLSFSLRTRQPLIVFKYCRPLLKSVTPLYFSIRRAAHCGLCFFKRRPHYSGICSVSILNNLIPFFKELTLKFFVVCPSGKMPKPAKFLSIVLTSRPRNISFFITSLVR